MTHGRFTIPINLALLLLTSCATSLACAQTTNPFQSLKDALNKVVKQLPNQPQAQPGAQPGAVQPTGAATPAAAAASSGSGQVWTPPGETGAPVAFKGPLDPAKLPDIGGVHIGEGREQAIAALKKIHPGAQLSAIPQPPDLPPAGMTLSFGNYQPPPSWDNTSVTFTFDSNQQTVYSVYRDVRYEPNISRQNLIDALRQKYGKETAAADVATQETHNDAAILKMWWLIDEQGVVQHPSRFDPNAHAPSGCMESAGGAEGVSRYRTEASGYVAGRLPAATYCDSLIMLTAVLDQGSRPDLVSNSRILLSDAALIRRSIVAMGDAQMSKARQRQQNELKKASEAKPNL